MFNSSVPLFMGESFKSLVQLNLARNRFSNIQGGLLTIFLNRCHLKSLDLSSNKLQEEILRPNRGNRCVAYDLEILHLSDNKFSGTLRQVLQGQLKHLQRLDLKGNLFSGTVQVSLGSFLALEELQLGDIQLRGPIPSSLGRLTALRKLGLSFNQLNGTIPVSLGQLEALDVSSNSLEVVVSKGHFANLSMLKLLRTESNFMLTFKMRSGWILPFQLNYIEMGSCNLGPIFPTWLRSHEYVDLLDLSNASISGALPSWLRDMHVSEIDLSRNHISGPVSNLPISLEVADLSSNLLSGPLPHNITTNLKPSLATLLLGDNLLNGSIPEALSKISSLLAVLDLSRNWLQGSVPNSWKDLQELIAVKLLSNRLTGVIPSSFGHISSLQWLQLNNNSFYGKLPLDLSNCTSLIVLDVGENGISGNIPKWIRENLTNLRVLRLHKNKLSGIIPSELGVVPTL